MKIIPTSLKRATAVRKIAAKRAEEATYLKIKNNIKNKETLSILTNNKEQIARAASNKGLFVEFTKGENLFENSTMMNLYDVEYHLPKSMYGIPYTTTNYKTGTFLPESLNDNKLVEFIKKTISRVAEK